MDSNLPLLSIGLPVYNSQEYIEDVIHSLLQQSFHDFELIISDDNSTDSTICICKKFSELDSRIIVFKQNFNLGMVQNQNFVLNQARGKFFMWAAHDDYYDKEFINDLIRIIEANSRIVSVFCNIAIFTNSYIEYDKIVKLNFSQSSTVMRLVKFTIKFNDAHFYGIHRREVLNQTEVPTWWGKNQITPANSNYPVLYYLLSSGEYAYNDGKPLFYKRQKKENYSLGPSKTLFQQIFFLVIRKVNLLILSTKNTQRARKSLIITFIVYIALGARISYDSLREVSFLIKTHIKRVCY